MVEGGEVDGGTDVISGLTVYPAPGESNRGNPATALSTSVYVCRYE